jgi:hypothetical protein
MATTLSNVRTGRDQMLAQIIALRVERKAVWVAMQAESLAD